MGAYENSNEVSQQSVRRHSQDNPMLAQHQQHQQSLATQREMEEGAAEALAGGLYPINHGGPARSTQPAGMHTALQLISQHSWAQTLRTLSSQLAAHVLSPPESGVVHTMKPLV